jgi:transposase
VRLLAAGNVNKVDPDDARSVAIAALRSAACPPVRADDHAAVLKVRAGRHRDLSRARNQVVCRLYAVLCELVPGGVSKQIHAAAAARLLDQIQPAGAVQAARRELPGSSWPACAASTPSAATPRRSWPRRSGPRAPP